MVVVITRRLLNGCTYLPQPSGWLLSFLGAFGMVPLFVLARSEWLLNRRGGAQSCIIVLSFTSYGMLKKSLSSRGGGGAKVADHELCTAFSTVEKMK